MTRKKEIRNKGVGVGLRVLNNLIENGSTRNNAEVFSAVAQSSFIEGAEWADKTTLEKTKSLIKEWELCTSTEAKYKVEAYKELMEIIEKEDKE